jgi:hypothetical protein
LEASERRNRSRNIVIAVASVVAGAVAGQVLAALVG